MPKEESVMLKTLTEAFFMNLQLFAEGDPSADPKGDPKPQEGKVFTEDYVKSLREEAKDHRLKAKTYEAKLKDLLGLKPDEESSDWDKVIQTHKINAVKALGETLSKAKELLLKAEIKALEGHNPKLFERLLDPSKVKIADDGTITGLKEAAEELAKEFPEVKKATTPPNSGASLSGLEMQLPLASSFV